MSRTVSPVILIAASVLSLVIDPVPSFAVGSAPGSIDRASVPELMGAAHPAEPAFGDAEPTAGTGGAFPAPVKRKIVLLGVETGGSLPVDLTAPEGTTRWDLTGLVTGGPVTRTIERSGGLVTLLDESGDPSTAPSAEKIEFSDPADGDAAIRWMFPDQDADTLRPSARTRLEVLERRGDDTGPGGDRLVIDIETIGAGWAHLPSGPREVALQRLLVLRRPDGAAGYEPDSLVYRWVDPLAGPVAEVRGPASADGRSWLGVSGAWVLDSVLAGESLAKLYVDEVNRPVMDSVQYGWDRGSGTTISSLTPDAHANIGALIAASSWDFSGNTTGVESASTVVSVSQAETCNYLQCGYTVPGGHMQRQDKNFDIPASLVKINTVEQREDRAGDVTIWLRAGSVKEGVSGAFGTGESRICYVGGGRTEVPLWRFSHQDAGGWFMQPGDLWSSGVFNCEQNIFNQVCGSGGFPPLLRSKSCTSGGGHAGTQSGEVIKSGVVTLPSGHTFNSLLVRTVADFCVYPDAGSCASILKLDDVRTAVYLWQVPVIGTVVRLMSAQNVPNVTTFTTLEETDIKFGIFPPLTIQTGAVTNNTIAVSWNPGNDTHRISGYKVYWDTDSGGTTSYAFNSQTHPGQVVFAGPSATISGLTPGTNYFITVTSLSAYTDPSTSVTTTYESLVYPTQVFGDPSSVYPVEVQAMTTGGTCIPTAQVTGLMVQESGPSYQISWNAASDPCLVGYRILGANSPNSPANFTTVTDTGIATSWTGSPTQQFYLVVTRGTGGTGPWGHYSQ